tara:strand:- start:384 stop:911 length:528 start_codon:yes stop_codon:yes gene_type:complete
MNLQGKLLVSHPSLTQGLFAKAVVYIYQHEHKGSLGVILNKRSNYSLADIMAQKNIAYEQGNMVFTGGPMNQQALQVLHSDDWYSQNTLQLPQGLSISSDNVMLEKLAMGNEPSLWRVFNGMAAWGPNQLEQELAQPNGWMIAQADYGIVFDTSEHQQWMKAIEQVSQSVMDNYL